MATSRLNRGDFGSGAAMSCATCDRLSTFGSDRSGLGRSSCWSTDARSWPMVARNRRNTRIAGFAWEHTADRIEGAIRERLVRRNDG